MQNDPINPASVSASAANVDSAPPCGGAVSFNGTLRRRIEDPNSLHNTLIRIVALVEAAKRVRSARDGGDDVFDACDAVFSALADLEKHGDI